MTIADIYNHYNIPPNLVRHMYEVTAVGLYICSQWKKGDVDAQLVKEALLFHDMGNIVKFKRPFLGELENRAQYWTQIQNDFIQKYGSDAHEATMNILRELRADELLLNLTDSVGYHHLPKYTGHITPEMRITEFADCAVSPEGIVGFAVRLQDLLQRYTRSADDPEMRVLEKNAEAIASSTGLNVDNLPVEEILTYMTDLPQTELTHLLDR